MSGKELLKEVVVSSGLPEEPLARELHQLLDKAGLPVENCSLDDLRNILAEYLQDVLLQSQATYSK